MLARRSLLDIDPDMGEGLDEDRRLAADRDLVGRIEIPLTEHHFEAAYVARAVPLARGWERQLEIAANPLFYEPGLDADRLSARLWQRAG